MVKEVDKTRIKNWVIGDTFSYKINSNEYPEYNDNYIIFTFIPTPSTWEKIRTEKMFISKITKDKTLPKTQDEYDALETIKMGLEDPVELANRLYEIKYSAIPDDYGYIYDYSFEIRFPKFCIENDMKYIGNFAFVQPANSYLPNERFYGLDYLRYDDRFDELITKKILWYYENINLQKGVKFSEEYLKNRDKIRQDNIDFMNHLRKVSEEIRKKCEIYGCDTKKHRDTCTYVGHKKNKK